MKSQSLSSASQVVWTFRQAGTDEWMPATVPGGVHTDLLALGRIPDPFVADNELKVQWVAEADWEYRGVFEASPGGRMFLVADGLDTLAEVYLNGQRLGETENMFRTYRWPVDGILRSGQNELRILFRSAVKYCLKRNAEKPLTPKTGMSLEGSVFVRKAPCHFGWDWGPKLPPIGIWRDLRLEQYASARLEDVHLRQQHRNGTVTLSAAVRAERWDNVPLVAHLKVTTPNGRRTYETHLPLEGNQGQLAVRIRNPQLWWPNGYGEQPLYDVEVSLEAEGTVQDRKQVKMGAKTPAHRYLA
ncbi:beta-galactosidase/beta-glucuronidase [Anaerolinea thermolimosa]|uniref:glycosyl hydrolase 2 galactose-binding domain-containing protein n=1 Tax=Anaerolinea thermolimosa TaxID=229919 RepID=UPI0007826FB7|nr:hypothetical protein [Anaerolinea thermolimosa]GAP05623.1 beta-galactosidase/beta-glucuronidase [Anaerolinea thermolimosa]